MIINADDFDSVDDAIKAKIMDPVVVKIHNVSKRGIFNTYYAVYMKIISQGFEYNWGGGAVSYDVTVVSRNYNKLAKYTVGVK